MSKNFCIYCGASLVEGSDFCNSCGKKVAKFEQKETEVVTKSADFIQADKPKEYVDDSDYYHRRRRRRHRVIPLVFGIIALLTIPFIIMTLIGISNVELLGTIPFEVESTDVVFVDLIIDNSVGSIDIIYDDTMTGLFESTLSVYGNKDSSISAANIFSMVNETDKLIIEFISGPFYGWGFFWRDDQFKYDIDIKINPIAQVNFDIKASTGSISASFNGINDVYLSQFSLQSNTGSIFVDSDAAENITLSDVFIETDTGRVDFDFDEALNTKIDDLYIDSDTGRVTVQLGTNTTLTDAEINISTSTGAVYLSFSDIIFTGDTYWNVETSTGSVKMTINQNNILPLMFTANFDLKTSTGDVVVDFIFNEDIGYKFTADTSTGDIELPGPGESYISPDYLLKDNKFSFILDTSIGDISAIDQS